MGYALFAATIVRANAAWKAVAFVNVNNHFEGSVPRSIGRLLEVLEREESG
jgi:chorismate mutase